MRSSSRSDLRARLVVIGPIPIAGADVGDLAQERRLGLPGRHRVVREPVAEILHRELEPVGQLARGGDGVRQVREEPGHLRRGFEIALGVGHQPPAGIGQRGVLADTGEHVVQRPLGLGREAHAVGGEDRHAERLGQRHEHLVVPGLVALQVPLHLHVDLLAAEDAHQPIQQPADAVAVGPQQRPAGQRHQPGHVPVEILERERALALRRAQLHRGDEAAEVAVALLGGDEDGLTGARD